MTTPPPSQPSRRGVLAGAASFAGSAAVLSAAVPPALVDAHIHPDKTTWGDS